MIVFERIFASYYFMFLKLRKINRARIEDFQAMCMICVIQFFLFSFLKVVIIKIFDISFKGRISIIIPIIFSAMLIYLNYKYFLSERNRRDEIISHYRILSAERKIVWTVLALAFVVIPAILFPLIF
jgi:hypothetical protein